MFSPSRWTTPKRERLRGSVGQQLAFHSPCGSRCGRIVRVTSDYGATEPTLARRALALEQTTRTEASWIAHSFPLAKNVASRLAGKIAISRYSGLLDPSEFGLDQVSTIKQLLAESDIVVADGAGLLGGPPAGSW